MRGVAAPMPGSQIARDMVKTSSRENRMRMIWVSRGGSRGRVQGVRTPPPPEMACSFLIQLAMVFCKKKEKPMWFTGVEVEQETSAPPP